MDLDIILIVGSGYVGLVSGACFAEMGHHVICLDQNTSKIEGLNHGEIPIYEPGLEEIINRNRKAGRLQFSCDYESCVAKASVCFLAVDTPTGSNGHADMSYIKSAARSIAMHLNSEKIIVNKSTVPVGTSKLIRQTIQEVLDERGVDYSFMVVSNPEFLKEGNAVSDFMKPDRVLIGAEDSQAIAIMKEIYAPFMLSHDRLIVMDPTSAEMTKYAANAMLALRISFMNELSGLCEIANADIGKVRMGIGSDKRIGYHFLYAGPGFGGSCFPKDIRALSAQARYFDYDTPLIDSIMISNQRQKCVMINKIMRYFSEKEGLAHTTIAIFGLAFKPDTDDVRESAALDLVKQLLEVGVRVRLFDPIANPNAKKALPSHPHITWCDNEIDAATTCDAIVLMTEWKQFRFLDFKQLLEVMYGNAFFDGRNQFKPEDIARKGFDYISIGRAAATACQTSDLESLIDDSISTMANAIE